MAGEGADGRGDRPAADDDEPSTTSALGAVQRTVVLRNAFAVAAATGAYGVSFGAVAVAAGLSPAQASASSLLGSRNTFYGLGLASRLRVRGFRRLAAAQLVIDESTAMATNQEDDRAARLAFWATGLCIFVLWNVATVVGALGAEALADPRVLGLDAAAPAAFLALLAPRLRHRELLVLAFGTGAIALAVTPLVPAGLAVLIAAVLAVLVGSRWVDRAPLP